MFVLKLRFWILYLSLVSYVILFSGAKLWSKEIQVKTISLKIGTARTFVISKEATRFESVRKNLVDISLDPQTERVYLLSLAKGHTVVTWFNDLDEVVEKWMIEIQSQEEFDSLSTNLVGAQKKFLQRKMISLESKVFTWRDQDSDVAGFNPNFDSKVIIEGKKLAKLSEGVELPVALQGMQDSLELMGAPKMILMEGSESSISLGGEMLVDSNDMDDVNTRNNRSHWKKVGLEMKFNFLEFRENSVFLKVGLQNSNPEGVGFLLANSLQTDLRFFLGEEKEVASFKLDNELKANWGHSWFKRVPILSALLGQYQNSNSHVYMRVWIKVASEDEIKK